MKCKEPVDDFWVKAVLRVSIDFGRGQFGFNRVASQETKGYDLSPYADELPLCEAVAARAATSVCEARRERCTRTWILAPWGMAAPVGAPAMGQTHSQVGQVAGRTVEASDAQAVS